MGQLNPYALAYWIFGASLGYTLGEGHGCALGLAIASGASCVLSLFFSKG